MFRPKGDNLCHFTKSVFHIIESMGVWVCGFVMPRGDNDTTQDEEASPSQHAIFLTVNQGN